MPEEEIERDMPECDPRNMSEEEKAYWESLSKNKYV